MIVATVELLKPTEIILFYAVRNSFFGLRFNFLNLFFSTRTSKVEHGAQHDRSRRELKSGWRWTSAGSTLSPLPRRWAGMLVLKYLYWLTWTGSILSLHGHSFHNGQFFIFEEFSEIYVKMSDPTPRFGGGRGQEFATAYSVQYWRAGTWHTYKNITGHSVRTENETA